jgi:hypothetical protein
MHGKKYGHNHGKFFLHGGKNISPLMEKKCHNGEKMGHKLPIMERKKESFLQYQSITCRWKSTLSFQLGPEPFYYLVRSKRALKK